MNLKNALVFVSALAVCVLASSCSDSHSSPQTGLDSRIRRLCQKAGIIELETEHGELLMIFSTAGGRRQMCIIAPQTVDADGIECVYVGSYIAKWDEIPENVMSTLMNQNARRRKNVLAESSDSLVLRALLPVDTPPKAFRDAVEALAVEADSIQSAYFGKDDFDQIK